MSRKNYFKIEFIRTFHNPRMYAALGIGLFLVVWNLILIIPISTSITNIQYGEIKYPLSAFEWRMATNAMFVPYSIFYLLFPLLASIPSGCSLYNDQRCGWMKSLLVRMDMKDYLKVKRFCLFMGGGFAVTFPLIIDFLLTACFFPAIVPDAVGGLGLLFPTTMGWEIYYTKPYIYLLLFLLIDFVFGGLYALFAGYMGTLLTNSFAVYAAPFLLHILIGYLAEMFGQEGISPTIMLASGQSSQKTSAWGLFGYFLLIVLLILALHRGCVKHEKIL